MKRPTPESVKLATYIHEFLTGYAPVHLTTSEHTLKNYKTSLSLYLVFLQEECGITRKDTVSHVQGKIIGEIQAQICIGT